MNRIKLLLTVLMIAPVFIIFTKPVAADHTSKHSVCTGIGLATNLNDCVEDPDSPNVSSLIQSIISILSFIVGVAAVIMIILGALKYITAGGDANKVGSAKTAITYALIGLVIAALAQVIVRFVFTEVTDTSTPPAVTQPTPDLTPRTPVRR